MTKQQKGKHRKRKRSWHHLRNQDRIFDDAARKLDQAWRQLGDASNDPISETKKQETQP